MSSMYFDYIKEREDSCTLANQHGFVIYEIDGDECYISDLYVRPESRRSGKAFELMKQVLDRATESKCKYILGAVNITSLTAPKTMMAMLRMGAKMLKCDDNLIYLIFPLEGANG